MKVKLVISATGDLASLLILNCFKKENLKVSVKRPDVVNFYVSKKSNTMLNSMQYLPTEYIFPAVTSGVQIFSHFILK